ncbi:hypothetical protein E1B28_011841 [Marasmius oreades]|uniref:Uncharacterized protein n=1 Tax=Marasmius oreades TaxID=181124 RepID=A0A9P7UQ12_9AGAR|nr:uncharacterized protein E1B28_011841 [Marasmius oreades]KAG7090242.1 hypothetical protein E1B28_011841 [Marasmius oreades]
MAPQPPPLMHIFQGASEVSIGSSTINNLASGDQVVHNYGDTNFNKDSYNTGYTNNYDSYNHVYNNHRRNKVTKTDKRKLSNTANFYGSGPTRESGDAPSSRRREEYTDSVEQPWATPPRSAPPARTRTITEQPHNETLSADDFPFQNGANGLGGPRKSPLPEEQEYEYAGYPQQPPRMNATRARTPSDDWEVNTAKYHKQAEMNTNPNYPMYSPRPQLPHPDMTDPNMPPGPPSYNPPYSYGYLQPPHGAPRNHPPPFSAPHPNESYYLPRRSPNGYSSNQYEPQHHQYAQDESHFPPRRSPNRHSPNENQPPYHQYAQHPPYQYSSSPQSDPDTSGPPSTQPGSHPDSQPSLTGPRNPYNNPFYNRSVDNASAPPSSTAATSPPAGFMAVDSN